MSVRLPSALTLLLASLALPATAGDAHFTDEAAFAAAAGSLSIEGFESFAPIVRSSAAVLAPRFTLSALSAGIGIQDGPDSPSTGFGGVATDGTHWVSVYLPGQAPGTLRFDLQAGSRAFGLNLSDLGETDGTVSLSTDVGAFAGGVTLLSYPPTQGEGVVQFVGLTQAQAFRHVYLTVTGIDEAYGIDRVQLAAVAEPAPAAMAAAGLLLLALARRRRG